MMGNGGVANNNKGNTFMSLWLRYRDTRGMEHHIAIPFDPLTFVAIIACVVGVIAAAIQSFSIVSARSPGVVGTVCAVALAVGLGALIVAKFSVIRQGRIVTFGPRLMSRKMRVIYAVGYVLLAFGTGCTLLFVLLTGSPK